MYIVDKEVKRAAVHRANEVLDWIDSEYSDLIGVNLTVSDDEVVIITTKRSELLRSTITETIQAGKIVASGRVIFRPARTVYTYDSGEIYTKEYGS